MHQKKSIAVIGAGISGLTCAYNLQKAGHNVIIYEANTYVGGRMSTRTKEFPMDTGANHLANVYSHMRILCDELELTWEPMDFLKYELHKNGKNVPLLESINRRAKFGLAITSMIGIRKDIDFFELSSAARYDKTNARHIMKKWGGRNLVEYLVDPFVSTYQFHLSDEISQGVLYAMMRSHYKHTKDWGLHRIKGGMIALPQALADRLNVRLSTPVKKVMAENGKVTVKTNGNNESFDAVVIATTASVAKKIYSNPTQEQHKVLEATKYASTVGVGFRVPAGTMKDTTIVWVPYVEGGKISGYTNEEMKGESMVKNGKTLILTWFHEEFAKSIIDKSDEEIFALTKKELAKVCPYVNSADTFENYDLQRWAEAMPKYYHGHLKLVKDFEEQHQGEQNVWLAGDYLNAPWTEGALRCGERVAEGIVKSNE